MSIKSFFGLAAAGIILSSCQSDTYQINGFAQEFQEGDTICMTLEDNPAKIIGSAIVSNGKFAMAGTTDTILLCRIYPKQLPKAAVTCFIEPGSITIELHCPPNPSRVSGTLINNDWQQLNDSVLLMGKELIRITQMTSNTSDSIHLSHLNAVDSLHRRISNYILNTAKRNSNNALGKYIEKNYKEPEFK